MCSTSFICSYIAIIDSILIILVCLLVLLLRILLLLLWWLILVLIAIIHLWSLISALITSNHSSIRCRSSKAELIICHAFEFFISHECNNDSNKCKHPEYYQYSHCIWIIVGTSLLVPRFEISSLYF